MYHPPRQDPSTLLSMHPPTPPQLFLDHCAIASYKPAYANHLYFNTTSQYDCGSTRWLSLPQQRLRTKVHAIYNFMLIPRVFTHPAKEEYGIPVDRSRRHVVVSEQHTSNTRTIKERVTPLDDSRSVCLPSRIQALQNLFPLGSLRKKSARAPRRRLADRRYVLGPRG